jgi:hypothetical protein
VVDFVISILRRLGRRTMSLRPTWDAQRDPADAAGRQPKKRSTLIFHKSTNLNEARS